ARRAAPARAARAAERGLRAGERRRVRAARRDARAVVGRPNARVPAAAELEACRLAATVVDGRLARVASERCEARGTRRIGAGEHWVARARASRVPAGAGARTRLVV